MQFRHHVAPSILALLLAGVVALPARAAVGDEVRFIVLGDSQLHAPAQFERMVHEANLLRPHFVAHTGDMIHGYTDDEGQLRHEWRRFLRQIEPLTTPFYPVPGNHDVGTPESHRVYGEVWGPDRYYYAYDHGAVRCIVLDSYRPDAKDRIAASQVAWLEQNLAEYAAANGGRGSAELAGRSIFVFVHSPFWRYHEASAGTEDWARVHAILTQYPVRMVIGGQTDRDHEYVWEQRDGIDYVLISSSAPMPQNNERAGYMHGMLHVSVVNGDVRTAVIRPGSILPMDTVNRAEHEAVKPHGLRDGILRIDKWQEGEPLALTVDVPVENPLGEARTMRLDWEIPRDSGVHVEPATAWLDLEAEQHATAQFRLTSMAAPPRDAMPHLRLSTRSVLRSGVVDRAWEAHYREEIAHATAGSDLMTTAIDLDRVYTFQATRALYVPPRTTAARRVGPIVIDGISDEQAWQAAAPLTDFSQGENGDSAPLRTTVRWLYDDEFLYVAAHMEEPIPAGLKTDAGGEIALTWNDDDFELFFDPTQRGQDHTRIFENAAGTRFSSQPLATPNRYRPLEYTSAIHIGEDHWSIEFRIPWSDITDATPPASGDAWGVNVWRHRQQSTPARFHWAVGTYDWGRYGVLEFE